ncbi:MAG: hypothetical protein ACRCWF_15195 [Beijerinckiaceae bacterium]
MPRRLTPDDKLSGVVPQEPVVRPILRYRLRIAAAAMVFRI